MFFFYFQFASNFHFCTSLNAIRKYLSSCWLHIVSFTRILAVNEKRKKQRRFSAFKENAEQRGKKAKNNNESSHTLCILRLFFHFMKSFVCKLMKNEREKLIFCSAFVVVTVDCCETQNALTKLKAKVNNNNARKNHCRRHNNNNNNKRNNKCICAAWAIVQVSDFSEMYS